MFIVIQFIQIQPPVCFDRCSGSKPLRKAMAACSIHHRFPSRKSILRALFHVHFWIQTANAFYEFSRQETSWPKTSTGLRTYFEEQNALPRWPAKLPGAELPPTPAEGASPPTSHLSKGTDPSSLPSRRRWHGDRPPTFAGAIQPLKQQSKPCTPGLAGLRHLKAVFVTQRPLNKFVLLYYPRGKRQQPQLSITWRNFRMHFGQ